MKVWKIKINCIGARRYSSNNLLMMKIKLRTKTAMIGQNQVYPSILTRESKPKFKLRRNMLIGGKTITILIYRHLYKHSKIVKVRSKRNKKSKTNCS